MGLTIATPEAYHQAYFDFHDKYEMIGNSFGREFTKSNLKPKPERKCRFCGRSYPEDKFRSEAHLIPESLGNTLLFSDFECDKCNNYFGTTYDDHLANYVGLSRIMSFTKNKGKIPAHVQAGKSISIRPDKLNGEDFLVISRDNSDDGTIFSDPTAGKISVKCTKLPYTPAFVYRAILKIALSVLPEKTVVEEYQMALQYLMRQISVKFTGGAIYGFIGHYQLTNTPYLYLFQKKGSSLPVHSHFLVLYFLNYILCFPVPFNKHDSFLYNKPFQFIDFPPMLPEHMLASDLNFQRFFEDMGSEEKVYNQKDELNITFDQIQPRVSAAYDLNSGKIEERPYDPSPIMQILISRTSNGHDLDELSQLIKKRWKKNDNKE